MQIKLVMRTLSDPDKKVTVLMNDKGKQAEGALTFLSEYVVENGSTITALFVGDPERADLRLLGEDRLLFDTGVLAAHDLNLNALTHASPA